MFRSSFILCALLGVVALASGAQLQKLTRQLDEVVVPLGGQVAKGASNVFGILDLAESDDDIEVPAVDNALSAAQPIVSVQASASASAQSQSVEKVENVEKVTESIEKLAEAIVKIAGEDEILVDGQNRQSSGNQNMGGAGQMAQGGQMAAGAGAYGQQSYGSPAPAPSSSYGSSSGYGSSGSSSMGSSGSSSMGSSSSSSSSSNVNHRGAVPFGYYTQVQYLPYAQQASQQLTNPLIFSPFIGLPDYIRARFGLGASVVSAGSTSGMASGSVAGAGSSGMGASSGMGSSYGSSSSSYGSSPSSYGSPSSGY